jgi:hypothetical protein
VATLPGLVVFAGFPSQAKDIAAENTIRFTVVTKVTPLVEIDGDVRAVSRHFVGQIGIDVCPILLVDQAACKLHKENRRPLFDGFVLVVLAAEHVFLFAITTLLALLAVVPDPERSISVVDDEVVLVDLRVRIEDSPTQRPCR